MYEPVNESSDGSDGGGGGQEASNRRLRHRRQLLREEMAATARATRLERRARLWACTAAGLLVLSLCALAAAAAVWNRPLSMMACDKMMSPWSSLWPAVEYWEGDIVNYFNHSTIYRGPPTLEREMAWHSLWYHHAIPVTKEGIFALNRTDPDLYYQVVDSDPQEPIYGAIAEVFHQLHCLNLIRQHSWPLELYDKDWGELYPSFLWEDPVLGRMHLDHCFEALRLSLMCYADITPVLNEHREGEGDDRQADFNTHHRCRNFNRIAEYVESMGYDLPPHATAFASFSSSSSSLAQG